MTPQQHSTADRPEWGPARNDPDSPVGRAAQRARDPWVDGAQRPDDN